MSYVKDHSIVEDTTV